MAKTGHAKRPARRRGSPGGRLIVSSALILLWGLVWSLAATQSEARLAAPQLPTDAQAGPSGGGWLLLPNGTVGKFDLAPMVDAKVDIRINGMIARVAVAQQFRNPSDHWTEGTYVFPLPETAAVDQMRIRAGGRVIEGQIKQRETARRTYEKAKREGKRASLLEFERPNIFTSNLANITPGETVTVEIEYQQAVTYQDGAFRLRYPMVVAPRFQPAPSAIAGSGVARSTADAARIAAPVNLDSDNPRNRVALGIDLDPGMSLASVDSPYHPITVRNADGNRLRVELADGLVAANRDFELVWQPAAGKGPKAALFGELIGDDAYLSVMLVPPGRDIPAPVGPRELQFVIDTSSSMYGASLDQAKAALRLALQRLSPGDRFNIIRFDNQTEALFPAPRPASAAHLEAGFDFVRRLTADGGTVMAPALETALAAPTETERLHQVVLLTDGAVGNEAELFTMVRGGLGDRRLFTVGIGVAPNSHFMRGIAGFGRGTHTYIGDASEVQAKMTALLRKLEQPAITDITVDWPDGVTPDLVPARLPDLYRGQPVVFTARLQRASLVRGGQVVITGRIAGATWRAALPLSDPRSADWLHQGVGKLWARNKIAALNASRLDGADDQTIRTGITQLALDHGLVSRFTSLVAVDVTPARPADAGLASRFVANELPAGWTARNLLGPLPRGATPSLWQIGLGLILLLAAALLMWRYPKPA